MLRTVPILLLGLLLGFVLFPLLNKWTEQPSSQASLDSTSTNDIDQSRQNAIVKAIQKVSPSVVSINTARLSDPFFDPFSEIRKIPGIGSGFVIQPDGYILTNSHVVDGAQDITITFSDGRRFNVLEIFIDRQLDLAVIHIDADDLPLLEFGDSDQVIIGEWAIALGNPFGLRFEDNKPTVTVGVISALNRVVRPEEDERAYKDMIQTDASINPGNSGGPLVNSLGQVIGVNTFILSQGGGLGMGFAVPIKRALEAAHQLIDQGSRDFWTGLDIHSVNTHIARTLGLSTARGALITVIEPLSPGESAGLLQGDVIVMANNQRVDSADDLIGAFRNAVVGDTIALKILRGRVFRGRGGGFFDTNLILEQDPRSEE
ncbi:MAG: trypsin-like serine protease [Candidatus Latescibacteria bacterium]|nr:trypsin-like serine protease [Candidatus Latescibacterota bacterium]MBT4139923.1 trypsin-like serine protease [Candidatus Latescibacterota bacterium]MBT5832495.1 trypsin-like serine protease [Candidatus Latescibacterota bacterium]